jgi:hypothetical protein
MAGKSSQFGTIQRQERMLKALLAYHGIVTRAAAAAGITPTSHYNWYREDQDYQNKVNSIKFQCHEEFKELVMQAVRKKIEEGNTTIIALCYKQVCLKEQENMQNLTPYKPVFKPLIKIAPHPMDIFAKDKMTQLAVKEFFEQEKKKVNPEKIDPSFFPKEDKR